MVTWDQARAATAAQMIEDQGPRSEDLAVETCGWETPTAFYVTVDTKAAVAGDEMAMLIGSIHYRVAKATGRAEWIPWTEAVDAPLEPDSTRAGDWSGVTD